MLLQKLLFRLDPEKAHGLALRFLNSPFSALISKKLPDKPIQLFGLTFKNPVGLAAGWDKNGVCVDALFRLGFGFVEVGTVTPKPQAGNPKPRLFRIPEKQALINRMGFNNAGIDALVKNISNRKESGILGVNIGKNKDTPLDRAFEDYNACLKAVYPYADYVVINISSPNTPGLRELQSPRYLNDLLSALKVAQKEYAGLYAKKMPILVKTTIDLPPENYVDFVRTVVDHEIAGLIISNTTVDHSSVSGQHHASEVGGLSGAPIRGDVTRMIAAIHEISGGKLPIIGVGGIFSAEDAKAHHDAGAQLLQLYTGFVYRGPRLIQEILENVF